jgi:dTDP-glucose pyrophosphorylase
MTQMLKNLIITPDITINDVLKRLNNTSQKVLLVVDENERLIGSINDGDIRRGILSGAVLENSISKIYNKKPIFIVESEYDFDQVKKHFIDNKIDLIPVIDKEEKIIDYITWDRAFSKCKSDIVPYEKINIPVVIMAGGKGKRLEPFTQVLPKPLIPIADKTIAEHIMEQFKKNGVNEFYLTLNYRGEMIQAYFNSINHLLNLHFIFEDDYYGTAGSLRLISKEISELFIVSNCDILVKADYADVIQFHQSNNADLTIMSAFQHHKIPYGVIDFGENGIVTRISEKPETTVAINTGVYVVNRDCIEMIPENVVFHMTDLIEKLIQNNRKVCTYPVNSDNYEDIGQWDEYHKTVRKFER